MFSFDCFLIRYEYLPLANFAPRRGVVCTLLSTCTLSITGQNSFTKGEGEYIVQRSRMSYGPFAGSSCAQVAAYYTQPRCFRTRPSHAMTLGGQRWKCWPPAWRSCSAEFWRREAGHPRRALLLEGRASSSLKPSTRPYALPQSSRMFTPGDDEA